MEELIQLLNDRFGVLETDKMIAYMDGLLEWNEKINLTAIRDREEFLEKHILDSLSCAQLPEFQNAKNVVDIGTGGGFPGIPLAIIAPDKRFLLVDSTRKKLRVIDDLAERLEIDNVTTLHARAEEAAKQPEYASCYDLCVSRAVAELKTLVKWCMPFVKKGGFFIAYKGAKAEQELEEAAKELKRCGGRLSRIEQVALPGQSADMHQLVVIEKVK